MTLTLPPHILATGVDVVEIRCPICDGDTVTPIDTDKAGEWECCTCGIHFIVKY